MAFPPVCCYQFPMKKYLLPLVAAVAALFSSAYAQAVTCYAINEGNSLYTFSSSVPGNATSTAITGLPMGYRTVGLDFRTTMRAGGANPGVGSLWALATNGTTVKVYQINPDTAAATEIGTLSGINTSGSDNTWFFGFDPATDTLRIMNFIDNYAVNPNTLVVTAQTKFNAPGASNPSPFPNMNGSAYSSAPYGGTSSIYFLEQGNNGLNTSSNISTGNFTALPAPGNAAFSVPAGLDIDGSLMLACFFNSNGGTNKTQLFSVSTSGAFTLLGDISSSPASLSLRALAIKPSSLPTPFEVTVKVSGPKKVSTAASSIKIKGTASCNAGISQVQYKLGNGKFKSAKGTKSWSFTARLKPGVNKITVQATGSNGVTSKAAKITVTRN